MSIKVLNEGFNKYFESFETLNEAQNHENDEINAVLRKAIKGNKLTKKEVQMMQDENIPLEIDDGNRVVPQHSWGTGKTTFTGDRTRVYGPTNPSEKHAGSKDNRLKRWGTPNYYKGRIERDQNRLDYAKRRIKSATDDDVISAYYDGKKSNPNYSLDQARMDISKNNIDAQSDIFDYQNAIKDDKKDLEHAYTSMHKDNQRSSKYNGWDLSTQRGYDGPIANDKKAMDSWQKVDLKNYLTKERNPEASDREISNSLRPYSDKYKDLKSSNNYAKKDLEWDKAFHNVREDDDIEKEVQSYRDKLIAKNNANKEKVKASQDRVDASEKEIDDYLKKLGVRESLRREVINSINL